MSDDFSLDEPREEYLTGDAELSEMSEKIVIFSNMMKNSENKGVLGCGHALTLWNYQNKWAFWM